MSHKRKAEDNKRLKKTYEETKNWYGPGVWYDEKTGRYYRLDFTNKWLKRQCSKVARRKLKNSDYIFTKKSGYKKLFDYWWELF